MIRIQNALNARRAILRDGDRGFTLIELLVVVIIIGILAAIAIPVYIGVQNNAKDSGVKSDLSNAKVAVVAYFTEENKLPISFESTVLLPKYGYSAPTVKEGNYVGGTAAIPTIDPATTPVGNFCIAAVSGTGAKFAASQDSGVVSGTCSAGALVKG